MNKDDDQKKEDNIMLEGVDEGKELKDKLNLCEKERDEYLDGWRRTKADLANYKADEMKRLEEMAKYGNEEIIKGMIGVLESFDLAMQSIKDEKSREGVEHIRSQLEETLKRHGLQKIELKIGDKFNPQFHEVLLQDETNSADEGEHDIVLEELSCGYMLHGKVIKTSKIKISK